MIRLILKIWPALLPITLYLLWVFVFSKLISRIFRKKDYIDANFDIIDEKTGQKTEKNAKIGRFSLENRVFVAVLYVSLLMMIFSLILLALKQVIERRCSHYKRRSSARRKSSLKTLFQIQQAPKKLLQLANTIYIIYPLYINATITVGFLLPLNACEKLKNWCSFLKNFIVIDN